MSEVTNIDRLVERYANIQEALKITLNERDKILAELWGYMEANKAKRVETPNYIATIPTKRKYDVEKFRKEFGELDLLGKETFDQIFKPEHSKMTVIPAKVDGTRAKVLWDMGEEFVEKLERTLLPQKPEIKIQAVKKEHPL